MIWVSRSPKRRMPRSNSVSGGRSVELLGDLRRRRWPRRSARPGRRAVPLRTLVPMKTQLVRSDRPAFSPAVPGYFFDREGLAGEHGLVDEEVLGFEHHAHRPGSGCRPTACITSPGTTLSDGQRSAGCPSRRTTECDRDLRTQLLDCVAGDVLLHETEQGAAEDDRQHHACVDPLPAATREIIAAAIRMSTSGLLNWLANRLIVVALFMALSALGPYCFRRSAAWRLESP